MAKIKTDQDEGSTVTITRAGETKTRHHVAAGGVITVRKADAADVLALLPGSRLVEGTLDEPDADPDSPPDLPAPQ